jgi:hypothetical protein
MSLIATGSGIKTRSPDEDTRQDTCVDAVAPTQKVEASIEKEASEEEEDPLDAYMAGINDTVRREQDAGPKERNDRVSIYYEVYILFITHTGIGHTW